MFHKCIASVHADQKIEFHIHGGLGELGREESYLQRQPWEAFARVGFRTVINDHTFVQDLVADGTLSQEEAERHPLRNVLGQCVGCGSLKAESGRFKIMAGDRLLLCSDGLIRHVSDDSIKTVLGEGNARQAVEKLLDQALHAGGKDNVTVVVMEIPSF